MQRHLLIIAGPDKGRRFSVEDGQTLTIGRGEASDTQIQDRRMSRVHCKVRVDGGRTLLIDADSRSGTYLWDVQVTQCEIHPGDVFQVGDTHIRLDLEGVWEQATPAGVAPPKPHAQPAAAPALKDLVGKSLAHYRLERIIHRGHSGMLFQAFDTKKNRPAAVKVLAPEYASTDQDRDRFVRAMRTMIHVDHPNIVRLHAAGKQGPLCWSAMEFIEGSSIMEIIDRIGVQGMLDWRDVYRVAVHVGRALQCAYEHKIIHRNVTPQNLMQRTSDKVVKLCDLMLVKALEGTEARQVTATGQLVGDVAYMSPERTRDGADVDGRSDIYGLGATLYALLTGRAPFESDSFSELVRMVRDADPAKPNERQLCIDGRFQEAVLKMLAKRPHNRFQTPADMLRVLERIGKFAGIDADSPA